MQKEKEVWFIYDGKCPICNGAANAFMIKKALGNLNLIDARTQKNHPIMIEIKNLGLNIDEGMAIKFQNIIYHGADALHIMALIGTNSNFFNKLNCFLFRSKFLSKLCYPSLKSIRNLVLYSKGIKKINHE